ncbi:MAG: hypothetical protein P1U87_20850 [Verrucomicrobiales bacterium]|nr:hypothetical protein [Verrucomicrobiales bacterium]
MIHEKGNEILNSLELKVGKFALPQILRWIASFQVLTWALSLFSPDFLKWIIFDRNLILSGEVWRAFTWIFFPRLPGFSNPVIAILFVIIALMFMFFISDSLESVWNSFRVNVYTIATVVSLTLIGVLIPTGFAIGGLLTGVFYSAVFLAFATLFPNQVIHLFAVIPIKAKWLGIANAALLGATVLGSASPLVAGLIVIAGLLPYLLVFVPTMADQMRQRGNSAVRRHQFQSTTQAEGEAFHECESCGATEISHPALAFRVSADGEEYCEQCRPLKS